MKPGLNFQVSTITSYVFCRQQTRPVGQLSEGHNEIWVETAELLYIAFALITGYIPPESMEWQVVHDLRKNEFAWIHHYFP